MIYETYTKRVKDILDESRRKNNFNKGVHEEWDGFSGVTNNKTKMIHEQREFSNKVQLNAKPLNSILTPSTLEGAKIGQHPDFIYLKNTDETELHYIVSAFIDIKGSTKLFNEYELPVIYLITNTIQSAAIHTCIAMGGHIQRLQGDGVFAYFGGRGISQKKATEMAVTACAMFSYFVKNDLTNVFLQEEVEDIKTRIGIDFGDDKEVMWANFGLNEVSELTTLSLHTSLASKMQSYAKPNGIVVGQHIKDRLKLSEDIYDYVRDSKGEISRRYIFENQKKGFRYTQYTFDWYKFLKTLPFIKCEPNGDLHIITPEEQEADRLQRLRNTSSLLNSNQGYLNSTGLIGSAQDGVHHAPHKFHYGK